MSKSVLVKKKKPKAAKVPAGLGRLRRANSRPSVSPIMDEVNETGRPLAGNKAG